MGNGYLVPVDVDADVLRYLLGLPGPLALESAQVDDLVVDVDEDALLDHLLEVDLLLVVQVHDLAELLDAPVAVPSLGVQGHLCVCQTPSDKKLSAFVPGPITVDKV